MVLRTILSSTPVAEASVRGRQRAIRREVVHPGSVDFGEVHGEGRAHLPRGNADVDARNAVPVIKVDFDPHRVPCVERFIGQTRSARILRPQPLLEVALNAGFGSDVHIARCGQFCEIDTGRRRGIGGAEGASSAKEGNRREQGDGEHDLTSMDFSAQSIIPTKQTP